MIKMLVHDLQMNEDRLSKIVLIRHPSMAKQKVGGSRLGWEEVIKKD